MSENVNHSLTPADARQAGNQPQGSFGRYFVFAILLPFIFPLIIILAIIAASYEKFNQY